MPQKSVLITGCSEGGIGDALAKAFHRKGIRVFATARNLSRLEHLKKMGLELATGGTLDILVNNSGAGYGMPLLDTNVAQAKALFDVNVFGVIAVAQAFAPLLIPSKGTIVTVGSVAGLVPLYWGGYYNASKSAVNLLTDQLRLELAPLGVKVILVMTGGVKTKFFEKLPDVTLPSGSYYAPARQEIESAAGGNEMKKETFMDADVYAEAVVKNVLSRNPTARQFAGQKAGLTSLMVTYLPRILWEYALGQFSGLPQISKKIAAAQKPAQ
ncbi:hypothetical protein BP5796_05293 [Coleophoma crateriformis]|uniref:Uncharacterized protein n=1 Tax=Coleophoma crateriformis TaxID=565419 RepID=A0A3D8S2U2_9HELO|nr:hypothetical protein BP5796_05293 [Coleophoma crateriformis]